MNGSEIFLCILAVLAIMGYFKNIAKLFGRTETSSTKAIRIAGVIFPVVGVIMGWIGRDRRVKVI